MTKEKIFKFIRQRKVAILSSVDEKGFPVMRAMLKPRKIDGNMLWFSTNTSSNKVAELINNPKACVYFFRKGLFHYKGILLRGTMEVLTDRESKDMIWRRGDTLFYKGGVSDPDYCVLKFTASDAKWYCDLKKGQIQFDS